MPPSRVSRVVTSRRCGTLVSRSGAAERSAAHMIGSAAFLAPEMRTSPESGTPPRIRSLSMVLFFRRSGAPLLRSQGLHRQRMDFLAHALTQGLIHALV